MADLLASTNSGSLVSTGNDPIAPLTNPAGPPAPSTALSPLAAAQAASSAGASDHQALGLNLGQGLNNIVFLGALAFLIYKYGRRIF